MQSHRSLAVRQLGDLITQVFWEKMPGPVCDTAACTTQIMFGEATSSAVSSGLTAAMVFMSIKFALSPFAGGVALISSTSAEEALTLTVLSWSNPRPAKCRHSLRHRLLPPTSLSFSGDPGPASVFFMRTTTYSVSLRLGVVVDRSLRGRGGVGYGPPPAKASLQPDALWALFRPVWRAAFRAAIRTALGVLRLLVVD